VFSIYPRELEARRKRCTGQAMEFTELPREATAGCNVCETITKIDQGYWHCQETAPRIFFSMGFEIVSMEVGVEPGTIGYLLRRFKPRSTFASEGTIDAIVGRLCGIDADCLRTRVEPVRAFDSLHLLAYKAKRALLPSSIGEKDEKVGLVPQTLQPAKAFQDQAKHTQRLRAYSEVG
jgi:hypothetical protein